MESYNVLKLKNLLDEGKIAEAQQYIKTYFFKVRNPVCVYFRDTQENEMIQCSDMDIEKRYIPKSICYKYIAKTKSDDDKETKEYKYKKISDWFLSEEYTYYNLTMEVGKPQVFTEKEINYVNLFHGFQYQTHRIPTEDEKKGIDLLWKHFFDILCSKNEKAYQLAKKLISLTIAGRKTKVILYFRGPEGTGKGIFINFILDKVLGKEIAYCTGKTTCLEKFNAELKGKILLSLNELKCGSKEQWHQINEELKMLATEPIITLEAKGKDAINIKNLLSVWLTSNNNFVRITANDRRYLPLDISEEKIGDTVYFNELAK